MDRQLLLLTAAFPLLIFSGGATYRPDDDLLIREITNHPSPTAAAERSFRTFIETYEKNYGSRKEYILRLGIFARNLARAAEHQLLDPTAVHGITPFSDLTEEEFERTMMGLAALASPFSVAELPISPSLAAKELPENFDWREKGAVTDVKMQGSCGSCWAFSTTGAVEGANFVATGKLLRLSEQQLIDCDHTCDAKEKDACDNGCRGGLMTNAYGYLMRAGGLQNESSYPYTGRQGACKFERIKVAVKVTNFTSIALDEDQIAANLVLRGPLAVGLNAVFMQTYIGGVSCPLICSKSRVNHGVVLVGYGSKGYAPLRLGYRSHWIIKNSWGKRWGEQGYYKLCRGHGMCGVNTMVSAVAATSS